MLDFESDQRMCFDDVAWKRSDAVFDAWKVKLFEPDTLRAIGMFVAKHHGGTAVELCDPIAGAFNVTFRVIFRDNRSAVIRFPMPGVVMFPEEKTRSEVATINFLREKTSLPLPFILHWGMKEESPCGLGPFIIMEYINHENNLGNIINNPALRSDERQRLDPNIDMEKLEMLYGQMADILLQLSKINLPRIGSISEHGEDEFDVKARPISFPMNELTLADLHIAHLTSQRNDAIYNAGDCRRKYIARHLFRKLARKGRLATPSVPDNHSFKIWCDDLRPTNVLLNANLKVVGVIDWEFTYAAPAEFAYPTPWWLLIEQPEYWPDGLKSWKCEYERRSEVFLRVLGKREDVEVREGRLEEQQRLSGRMRDSWESGAFWVSYAARKSFAFDDIYWREIDERFFGERGAEGWRARIQLLETEEREGMEEFVERKVNEMESRVLAWEPDEMTREIEKNLSADAKINDK
ncbi:phosphotransferase family protein [Viridothelium virens]|uniref:Phosphotransferase family protein n=1 Tax=Viridothelium virens TaxID=1048519 RepID=A0A6A6HG15_VIRVR|nr:phosphotransferase family protein [Viridothelium virens]